MNKKPILIKTEYTESYKTPSFIHINDGVCWCFRVPRALRLPGPRLHDPRPKEKYCRALGKSLSKYIVEHWNKNDVFFWFKQVRDQWVELKWKLTIRPLFEPAHLIQLFSVQNAHFYCALLVKYSPLPVQLDVENTVGQDLARLPHHSHLITDIRKLLKS